MVVVTAGSELWISYHSGTEYSMHRRFAALKSEGNPAVSAENPPAAQGAHPNPGFWKVPAAHTVGTGDGASVGSREGAKDGSRDGTGVIDGARLTVGDGED